MPVVVLWVAVLPGVVIVKVTSTSSELTSVMVSVSHEPLIVSFVSVAVTLSAGTLTSSAEPSSLVVAITTDAFARFAPFMT